MPSEVEFDQMSDQMKAQANADASASNAKNNPESEESIKKSARARWPALESNSETFTEFLKNLVAPGPLHVAVHDVFGFDPELLMMLPQPVYAMILLFPPRNLRKQDKDLSNLKRSRDDMEKNSEKKISESEDKKDLKNTKQYFLRQTTALGNACGTIACIHALANLRNEIPYPDDSIIGEFVKDSRNLSVSERGEFMETFERMRKEQQKSAHNSRNQTAANEGKVDYHFVCFLPDPIDGTITEFDGCKWDQNNGAPIRHEKYGTTELTGLSFQERCGQVIKGEFMEKMPDELNFVALAIGPAEGGF